MNFSAKEIEKIEVIGDRLLIKPRTLDNNTKSGLILPPSVQESEPIQSGYVIKVGPGYPIPNIEPNESWKPASDAINYVPLQVQVGDLAIFLQKQAYEIQFNSQKYFILSQAAVLMVVRDEF
jgi:chaperonin GroES